MHSYNRVIKAEDATLPDPPVKLVRTPSVPPNHGSGSGGPRQALSGSREEAPVRFVRGIGHFQAQGSALNSRENNRGISDKIEKIKKQSEERIKIVEKDTYARGFSEGLKKGIDQEKMELSLAVESVTKLIKELKTLKKELLEGSEKQIIDLAFLIARKVIHQEVNTDRKVILSVLRDAMKNVQEREVVRIKLNSSDYRHIVEGKPDFLDVFSDIVIEKDDDIGQGGAMIEAYSGAVDARLDTQLNKIVESLCDEHGF
jgi:flagellar assembly protein FliH